MFSGSSKTGEAGRGEETDILEEAPGEAERAEQAELPPVGATARRRRPRPRATQRDQLDAAFAALPPIAARGRGRAQQQGVGYGGRQRGRNARRARPPPWRKK